MPESKLPQIIGKIVNTYDSEDGINHIEGSNLPSRDGVVEIVVDFLNVLFPGYYEKHELSRGDITYYIWEKIASLYHLLHREILKSLKSTYGNQSDEKKLSEQSIAITFLILNKIPKIREQLRQDVRAAYEGDPAAKSLDEIIVSYPGIEAIAVHAIMIHMPMPEGVDAYRIQELIDPVKDVEGVNPANIGNVVYGRSMRAPCTALATLKLIDSTGVDLKGKMCVVVGASAVVGRPIAVLLMQREATVVSCNKFTGKLKDLCLSADVLIPAAGVAGLITGDMVRAGALVVDVGVNRVKSENGKSRTVGDVDFEGVKGVAGWISPVPGGVGPMTVSVLLHNVIEVAQDRAELV